MSRDAVRTRHEGAVKRRLFTVCVTLTLSGAGAVCRATADKDKP
jgi:hypothetical protein